MNIFKPLYIYSLRIIAISILAIGNPLISSRILTSLDLVLPAIYASYPETRHTLYKIALVTLVIYAIVSPLTFSMYGTFFN